jgi:hypothetical protein
MSSIMDTIFAGFMLVVFGMSVLIGLGIFTSIATTGIFGSYKSDMQQFFTSLNSMAIFIAIGISLAAVFSGLMIRSHPAFFIIAIIFVFVEFATVPTFVQVYNGLAVGMSAQVQADMAQQSQIIQMLPVLTALGTMLAVIVGLVRE